MAGLGLLKVKGKKKDNLCVCIMMVNDKYGHISYHPFDLFHFFLEYNFLLLFISPFLVQSSYSVLPFGSHRIKPGA